MTKQNKLLNTYLTLFSLLVIISLVTIPTLALRKPAKDMLDNPMKEIPIPLNGVLFQQGNNRELEKKVDYLTEVIRDKKEVEVHWETLRDRDYMVVSTIEKGVKEVIKHELKKPRLNG